MGEAGARATVVLTRLVLAVVEGGFLSGDEGGALVMGCRTGKLLDMPLLMVPAAPGATDVLGRLEVGSPFVTRSTVVLLFMGGGC